MRSVHQGATWGILDFCLPQPRILICCQILGLDRAFSPCAKSVLNLTCFVFKYSLEKMNWDIIEHVRLTALKITEKRL